MTSCQKRSAAWSLVNYMLFWSVDVFRDTLASHLKRKERKRSGRKDDWKDRFKVLPWFCRNINEPTTPRRQGITIRERFETGWQTSDCFPGNRIVTRYVDELIAGIRAPWQIPGIKLLVIESRFEFWLMRLLLSLSTIIITIHVDETTPWDGFVSNIGIRTASVRYLKKQNWSILQITQATV